MESNISVLERIDSKFLLNQIVSILEEVVRLNPDKASSSLMPEQACQAPAVTLSSLLKKVLFGAKIEKSMLVIALMYLDNYMVSQNTFVTASNVSLFFMTSLIIANKFYSDSVVSFESWAALCKTNVSLLAEMENNMLQALNYNLKISARDFQDTVSCLAG